MQPIVWDTSIYISKMRSGLIWDLADNDRVTLSSVVAAELITGFVNKPKGLLSFDLFVKSMTERNRIITPSHNDWYLTGIIIGKILATRPDLKNKRSLLFNDCLICTSGKKINAKVVTSNIKDFELIRQYINFNVSYQTC